MIWSIILCIGLVRAGGPTHGDGSMFKDFVRLPAINTQQCSLQVGKDCYGNDMSNVPSSSAQGCCSQCQNISGCGGFAYFQGVCYLKSSCSSYSDKSDTTAGTVSGPPPADQCSIMQGKDCVGNDLSNTKASDAGDCCSICKSNGACSAFAYAYGTCYLKSSCAGLISKGDVTAGTIGNQPDIGPTPVPPSKSRDIAQGVLNNLSQNDKLSILNGVGWDSWNQRSGYYMGNLVRVNGVPSMNMQDAAQGFRTIDKRMIGQVTAWPCALGVASTWEPALVQNWTTAMGEEFKAKGANMILGPSVNIHRVPRGGRNAEYMSGESPYFGEQMARAYVLGVQSKGVMAIAKHYGFNNQETNRNGVDVHIDARTAWEVYYPPFKGAVDAGVAAFMCSYNLVNGTHSCGSKQLLDIDLKRSMNFSGFVSTDWWALHQDGTQDSGVDVDMPGTDGYFSQGKLSASSQDRIDNMALRILTSMASVGMLADGNNTEWCTPPGGCDNYMYNVKATNDDHVALARKIARDSIALLKNNNNVLPLKSGAKVAVAGSACDDYNDINGMFNDWTKGNYYVMGGSGRVIPANPVSVVNGLRNNGVQVTQYSNNDNAGDAVRAASGADVLVVCAGTTSTESRDRSNLMVDQDSFIGDVVRQSSVPTVVLLMTPGTFVASWAGQADAVLNMFLGGEQTGNAWADVLTGNVSPSGKLPLTIPKSENDVIPPCGSNPCNYDEKLKYGWRGLEGKDVEFPFGHGMSYTTFNYTWVNKPDASNCASDGNSGVVCMSVGITNTGSVAGREVVQLYVGFPTVASDPDEPLKKMARFRKTTTLNPGQSETVTFNVDKKILSSYHGRWVMNTGQFDFSVGSSSRDIRLTGSGTVSQPTHFSY